MSEERKEKKTRTLETDAQRTFGHCGMRREVQMDTPLEMYRKQEGRKVSIDAVTCVAWVLEPWLEAEGGIKKR